MRTRPSGWRYTILRLFWVAASTAAFSVVWFGIVAATQRLFGAAQITAWVVGLALGAIVYGWVVSALVHSSRRWRPRGPAQPPSRV